MGEEARGRHHTSYQSMAMSSATLHPLNPRRSTTPPVSATTNDGDLPLDLLYEILLRLPTELICRFRAVCRSWQSLLCHPDFIAAAHYPGPLLAIGVKDFASNEVHVLDMESGDAVKHVNIAPNDAFMSDAVSDDGVVCVIDKYCRLRILDLASGTFYLLPDTTPPLGYGCRTAIVGRAACTGELKVLTISSTYSQPEPQVCKIFNFGKGGWRDAESPPLKVMWSTRDLAIVNGAVYFLSDYDEYKVLQGHKIMAFDLHREAWRPVATSLLGPTKRFCCALAELDGQLVAVHTDRFLCTEIELWFLMDLDRSNWSKRYVITMPCHQKVPALKYYIVKSLAMLDDGRIVLWVRVAGQDIGADIEELWIYDPRTKTFVVGSRVPCCSRVSVFKWNLMDSTRRGAIDMAAKRLLIARRSRQSGAPSSTDKGLELIGASTEEYTCSN